MKKNSKKLLSSLLAMVMVLCSLPFAGVTFSASAENSGYYTYTVKNGKATITDCDMSISGDVVIPDTLGGHPVVKIGDYAFEGCSSLKTVDLGATEADMKAYMAMLPTAADTAEQAQYKFNKLREMLNQAKANVTMAQ